MTHMTSTIKKLAAEAITAFFLHPRWRGRRDTLRSGACLTLCCMFLLMLSGCRNEAVHSAMLARLDSLQRENEAYKEFTSDSLQTELCRYFDRHGSRNERMKAHYLLGRAYHDMGEIPHALECYQDAAQCADTTDRDCDYKTLSRIYGQMADLFFLQNLALEGEEANNEYIRYAWIAKDTMAALYGYTQKSVPYYILRDTDKVIEETKKAIAVCEKYDYPYTYSAYATVIRTLLARGRNHEAREYMNKFEDNTDLFDENHEIVSGRELYYYTGGLYQLGINNLDSAEVCFRKSLKSDYPYLSYKGLLMIYEKHRMADSIAKYAHLYAEEFDREVDNKNTIIIKQISSLYNYDSYRHKADVFEKRTVRQRLWIFSLLLCISIITLLFIIFLYVSHIKNIKRKLKIEQLRNEYILISNSYTSLYKEYNQLQLKELVNKSAIKEHYEKILEDKRTELNNLKKKIEELGATLKGIQSNDNLLTLNKEKIVIRLRNTQYVPNETDWEELRTAYKKICPTYYSYITNQKGFSVRDQLICLLLPLDFTTKDMSILFVVSQQSITNAKLKISKKLFEECKSNELTQRLKSVFFE